MHWKGKARSVWEILILTSIKGHFDFHRNCKCMFTDDLLQWVCIHVQHDGSLLDAVLQLEERVQRKRGHVRFTPALATLLHLLLKLYPSEETHTEINKLSNTYSTVRSDNVKKGRDHTMFLRHGIWWFYHGTEDIFWACIYIFLICIMSMTYHFEHLPSWNLDNTMVHVKIVVLGMLSILFTFTKGTAMVYYNGYIIWIFVTFNN